MLTAQSREDWRTRAHTVPISEAPRFLPEGLVLGAGTVLVAADSARRLQSLKGREARLLALLSAAYDRAIAPSVLGGIERATKAWSAGDECLAYMQLAHAGLGSLRDFRREAYRLHMADRALMHGATPRAVFAALHLDAGYIDTVGKLYNPDEPRVPAGSGRTSGEWINGEDAADGASAGRETDGEGTPGSSLLDRMPPPPASFLSELGAARLAELGAYAARLLGPAAAAVAAFGLLFIPSPNEVHVEGEVAGVPGLSYSWNRDETLLHLTYDDASGGQRTFALQIDGDLIRDDDGEVVGRVVGGNRIAIDTLAVLPDLVKQDEPRLCPAFAPDVAGSDQGKEYAANKARQYEDFVKSLINSPPTPSGYVYYLPNPAANGKPVSFDDCEQATGSILFEIKGEGIAKLANDLPGIMADNFVDQATRQIEASGGRSVVWIFAEENAALFARKWFDSKGCQGITVVYVPWVRSGR